MACLGGPVKPQALCGALAKVRKQGKWGRLDFVSRTAPFHLSRACQCGMI